MWGCALYSDCSPGDAGAISGNTKCCFFLSGRQAVRCMGSIYVCCRDWGYRLQLYVHGTSHSNRISSCVYQSVTCLLSSQLIKIQISSNMHLRLILPDLKHHNPGTAAFHDLKEPYCSIAIATGRHGCFRWRDPPKRALLSDPVLYDNPEWMPILRHMTQFTRVLLLGKPQPDFSTSLAVPANHSHTSGPDPSHDIVENLPQVLNLGGVVHHQVGESGFYVRRSIPPLQMKQKLAVNAKSLPTNCSWILPWVLCRNGTCWGRESWGWMPQELAVVGEAFTGVNSPLPSAKEGPDLRIKSMTGGGFLTPMGIHLSVQSNTFGGRWRTKGLFWLKDKTSAPKRRQHKMFFSNLTGELTTNILISWTATAVLLTEIVCWNFCLSEQEPWLGIFCCSLFQELPVLEKDQCPQMVNQLPCFAEEFSWPE